MQRREFMALLCGAAIAWPRAVGAQSRVYRIGLLSSAAAIPENNPQTTALVGGLAEHGYELRKNLEIESRGAEAHPERLPGLIEELVASKIDVLVTLGYPAALAAKQAGNVPVAAFGAGDPVGTGLVASLARPGGNLTGISDVSAEVTPKRLELLKQIAPRLQKVAMLWNADDLGMTLRYRASETGAQALGIVVQPLGVREPNDFGQAFAAMNRDVPDAILMVSDALTILNRKRVFEFAAAHRLPAIYEDDRHVHDGGLMSYGPDRNESFARIAALVGRILKGTKPAELPFEQPTRFRFALNLRTAKSLGLEVPSTLLALADEVVE
jgi:putative tryptophan/tyrosine transport system substrate-binding protein